MPESRRKERMLKSGRLSLPPAPKLELEGVYDPRMDTCIKAFVRLLAERAASSGA